MIDPDDQILRARRSQFDHAQRKLARGGKDDRLGLHVVSSSSVKGASQ